MIREQLILSLAIISAGFAWATVARAQSPTEDPILEVVAYIRARQDDKAIAALGEIIKRQPDHVDAYILRSNLRSTSGDIAGALADISKAIELKPAHGSAYYGRALLHLTGNDPAAAVKDLDLAIANNYKIDAVYILRSQLRRQQKDFSGALADLNESLKLNPHNPRSYVERADLLLMFEDKDRAFADLNYVLTWYETDPRDRPVPKVSKSGAPPANSKDKEQTPNRFTVGVDIETVNESPADPKMAPVIANAYLHRGLIYSARGNADAAIADFTMSIKLEPADSGAYFRRALEFEGKGDLAAALADLRKSIELDPRNGNALVEHGVILLLQGKSNEAQIDFDRLLKSNPVLWQKRIDERTAAVKKKLAAISDPKK
jgi:tetratricopeptide (TPR) repeat protein